jgi:tRNA 2-thiocytidine biosynthesis protein TtcA
VSLEQRLARDMSRAILDHRLIAPADRILVAMSGGKDSYALYTLLERLQRRAPVDFSLVAVHVDQKQPGYDGAPLHTWLAANTREFHVIEEDTYSIVTDLVSEGKTYCSLCSRLRRGVLYRVAGELGCNKIALGHHRDDTLETLLLNLFFAGKLSAMPAKLTNDAGTCEVIRPLIYCAEPDLAAFAREQAYPIMPCNLCGSQSQAQRKQMKALLTEMEAKHPSLKANMMAALGNVRPTQLLDRALRRETAQPESGRSSVPETSDVL